MSAAAVTNVGRRIGFLHDRRIEEYDLPNRVARPATLGTALRLLEQHEAEAEALSRFHTLKQRTEARPLETAEREMLRAAHEVARGRAGLKG
ncbi:hypothetical protein AB0N09_14340 [Streptomyces erythrochromogenes]|uniref:hypothetical protein n=1 Tax=Streptomyces erythrochromogenes TaxID=285574 RepID=UPI00344AFBFA